MIIKKLADNASNRIFEIDFLRGAAVILVMFRHLHNSDFSVKIPYLHKAGWMGVDLFFVISGFLISGILFNELDKTGTIDFKRFFIRRGFKIYPAFYALILFTIVYKLFAHKYIEWCNLFNELVFLQSYRAGILVHTWSLGVEEHFYILLPILILIIVRFGFGELYKNNIILFLYVFIAILCLGLRLAYSLNNDFDIYKNTFNSHMRFDSLFFGVLLSYYYRYKQVELLNFFKTYKPLLLLSAIIFSCLPLFIDSYSFYMYTIGFTLISWGFGTILIFLLIYNTSSINNKMKTSHFCRLFSTVGYYSYSIYLWHIPTEGIINKFGLYDKMPIGFLFCIYFISCVLIGILLARLIEIPMIKIRNNYFPA